MLLFGTAVFLYFLQYAVSLYSPTALFLEEVSTNSLSVRWRPFFDETIEFLAYISPADEGEDIEPQYINETFATWVDLIPGKNYSIAVESVDQGGGRSLPVFLNVATEPLPVHQIRISKFVNPVLTRHTMSGNKTMMFPVYGAVVMWEGPDVGYFDGFDVRVDPPHGVVRLPVVIHAGKPIPQAKKKRRIVWNLTPGIDYQFTVRTKSHNRLSRPISTQKRMPPEIPAAIKVTNLTPTSVSLSWDQPHRGLVDTYIIEISPPEGEVIAPAVATEKRRRIENLTPGSMYTVDVYSTSFNILSFQSRSIHIRTPPLPPLGPVLVSDVTTSSMVVRWRWPGSNVQYYEVVFYPTSENNGRLRRRISDPEIQLNHLKADTEYFLAFYSIANKVYSKPLQATVRTSKTTSHTTTAVSPTVTSRPVTAPRDAPEQQPASTRPNENSTRDNQSTTKADSHMYKTKHIATTSKPQLMEHFSMPYTSPKIVRPFSSTSYYAGRVTSVPEAPIETTASRFDPIVQVDSKTTTEASLTQDNRYTVSVATYPQTTTTQKPAERLESSTPTTYQPHIIVETIPTQSSFLSTATTNVPPTTTSKVSTTTLTSNNVRLIGGEMLSTTTKQLLRETVATTPGQPIASSTSRNPLTISPTLRATMPTKASETNIITLLTTAPTTAVPTTSTTSMETFLTALPGKVESTKIPLTRRETAEATSITNNKIEVATTKINVPIVVTSDKFVTRLAMFQPGTGTFALNKTKPVSKALVPSTTRNPNSVSKNITFKTTTSFSPRDMSSQEKNISSTEALFEQITASSFMPTLASTTNDIKNGESHVSTDTFSTSTKQEHVATESFTSNTTGTKPTTLDATLHYSRTIKFTTAESTKHYPTTLKEKTELSTFALIGPTLKTMIELLIPRTDIASKNLTELQTLNATETPLRLTSTKPTTSDGISPGTQTVKSTATESNTMQPMTTHPTSTEQIESTTKEPTGVDETDSEQTELSFTTLTPIIRDFSTVYWTSVKSSAPPLYATSSATQSSTVQPTETVVPTYATESTVSKEITTESFTGQPNVAQTTKLQLHGMKSTTMETNTTESAILKQNATYPVTSKLNATEPAVESTTALTASDQTSTEFALSDESTTGVAPMVRDAGSNQTLTSPASVTTIPLTKMVSLQPEISNTTFTGFGSGPRQIIDHNRVSSAFMTTQTDKSHTTIAVTTVLSDTGMTASIDGAVTSRANGTVVPIKNGFTTMCQPDNITVLVDKNVIGEYEKKFGPLHLNAQDDPLCRGEEYGSYYRYTIAPDILNCGTRIELNGTHVNFTNTVSNAKYRRSWLRSLSDRSGTVIMGNRLKTKQMRFVQMKIWCTFPLDLNVSSQYPFLPKLRSQLINFNVSGHGTFSAVMQLYKTSKYEVAYLAPPMIDSTDTIYVELSLLEAEDEATVMIVQRCWATPVRNPDDIKRYPIIKESCPVAGNLEGSIRMTGNGKSKSVRWEGSVFKFVSYKEVWLHCEIRICFGDNCRPDCNFNTRTRRAERSVRNSKLHILSTGPISMGNKINKQDDSTSQESVTDLPGAGATIIADSTIFIVIVILSVVIFASCVVVICTIARLRRYNRKESPTRRVSRTGSSSSISCETQTYPLPRYDSPRDYVERTRPQLTTFTLNRRKNTSGNSSGTTTDPEFTTLELVHEHSKHLGYLSTGVYNTAYVNSDRVRPDSEYTSSTLT